MRHAAQTVEQAPVNSALLNVVTPMGLSFEKNRLSIGENIGKAYGIIRYPQKVDVEWLSKLTNIPSTLVSIGFKPVDNGTLERDFREADGQEYDEDILLGREGETQVVYYNQLDERWSDEPYGQDKIGTHGCGPTSMSIVVSTLTGTNVNPVEMAQWSYENGYYCPGGGSYHSLIPKAAEHWGLSVDMNLEGENVADALAEGKLVVAIMSKGHFTKSGHFIVLRGINTDGKVLVADPASLKRSNQEWELSLILEEARKRVGAGGPFWAISN